MIACAAFRQGTALSALGAVYTVGQFVFAGLSHGVMLIDLLTFLMCNAMQ